MHHNRGVDVHMISKRNGNKACNLK